MDPIIYVAIGLEIIFVTAFVWNIVSFFTSAYSHASNERKYNTPRRSRRSMLNTPKKTLEKVSQPQYEKVKAVYSV